MAVRLRLWIRLGPCTDDPERPGWLVRALGSRLFALYAKATFDGVDSGGEIRREFLQAAN